MQQNKSSETKKYPHYFFTFHLYKEKKDDGNKTFLLQFLKYEYDILRVTVWLFISPYMYFSNDTKISKIR